MKRLHGSGEEIFSWGDLELKNHSDRRDSLDDRGLRSVDGEGENAKGEEKFVV